MYWARTGCGRRAIFMVGLMTAGWALLWAPTVRRQAERTLRIAAKPVISTNPTELLRTWPKLRPAAPKLLPAARSRSPSCELTLSGIGDVLMINVWKETELSKTVPVRPDGMITLPLLGEVKARGLTPVQVEGTAYRHCKKVVTDPQVTVMVCR